MKLDLQDLNEAQREAVQHPGGPLLVLAGAGSGKTRVITYRIAWLAAELHVEPWSILGVTFTNKAAGEMLERVARLVPGSGGRGPRIGTFHSVSLRILRRHAERLGFSKSFTVYDTSDQQAVLRRILKDLKIDEQRFPLRGVASRISRAKSELIGPVAFQRDFTGFYESTVGEVYHAYQKRMRELDAMDFDDLIGKHVELLREHPEARDQVRSMARHLLIDEYQDTNHAQYALIRELAGDEANVTAVGDEDQSIYRFRGAQIENILRFEKDFIGARVIKLEQNYRSTTAILSAAIGVVSNNVSRIGKTLYAQAGGGERVRIVTCASDRDEAEWVIRTIRELRGPYRLQDFAILFRTNAQSRSFEDELRRADLPYCLVGGVKFYERTEIKDAIAFMRLAVRPNDSTSVERVINVPSRGVGDTTLRALIEESARNGVSLWTTIEGELEFLPERARRAIREFRDIVRDLQEASSLPVDRFIEKVFERTGYRRVYEQSRDPQDEARVENLDELVNAAREFLERNPESTLSDYLDGITLMADVDGYDEGRGVTLMTLHAAKGLEFKAVFLAGLEKGLLPHFQSMEEPGGVEEERRLCYVGMTRARERLYLTHCRTRRVHGLLREQEASVFIDEVPSEHTERIQVGATSWNSAPRKSWQDDDEPWESRPRANAGGDVQKFFGGGPVRFDPQAMRPAGPSGSSAGAAKGPRRGARVRHEQFGEGIVLKMEGTGDTAKLTVYFERAGTKKFIAKFAKLQWL